MENISHKKHNIVSFTAFLLSLLVMVSCTTPKGSGGLESPITTLVVSTDSNNTVHDKNIIIEAIHLPLHPQNSIPVEFSAKVYGVTGIQKIKLEVFEFEISQGPDNTRQIVQRKGGLWGEVNSWDFQNKDTAQVTHQLKRGFPANTFVEYKFTVEGKNGTYTKSVKMQAGTSPFGGKEILLYSCSSEDATKTFEMCFIPRKQDYDGQLDTFRKHLEIPLYKSYLKNAMILGHAEEWAFYYTPIPLNASHGNLPKLPPELENASLDFFSVLHKNEYRDASSGNMFSCEYNAVGTLLHETGHCSFDLSDEYKGSNSAHNSCNVFSSASACKEANNGVKCRSFKTGPFSSCYSIEPATPNCVMNDDGNFKIMPYQSRCSLCILDKYEKLNQQKIPAYAFNKGKDPFFHTEKIIIVKLSFSNGKWDASVLDITNGIRTLGLNESYNVMVNLFSENKQQLFGLLIEDPRLLFIDDGPGENKVVTHKTAEKIIRLPYTENITTLAIEDLSEAKSFTSVEISLKEQLIKLINSKK